MPQANYRPETSVVMEALEMLDWMPKYPVRDKARVVIAAAVASFADDRATEHENLGVVIPLDWLMQEIAKSCTWFPSPIKMREIYETTFRPLDGRETWEFNGDD